MVPFSVSGIIEAFGDSITAASFTPWFGSAVQQLYAAGIHLVGANYAVAGQQQADSYALALAHIPVDHPNFATWFPYSVNDGWTETSIYADYNAYVENFIALCHANGTIPVLLTQIPTARINDVPAENARLAVNDMVRALASDTVIVADMDAVMSDHNSPIADIVAAYTTDGTHVSSAGAAVMAPVLRDAVINWLASH